MLKRTFEFGEMRGALEEVFECPIRIVGIRTQQQTQEPQSVVESWEQVRRFSLFLFFFLFFFSLLFFFLVRRFARWMD